MASAAIPDIDAWSYYDHRIGEDRPSTAPNWVAPGWLPETALRRLRAYRFLDGVRRNVGRYWSAQDNRNDFREFGMAALYSDHIAAGVVGDAVAVAVDGLEREIPPAPVVPPRPVEPGNEDERPVYDATLAEWVADRDQQIEEWTAARQERPTLEGGQQWLDAWARSENLTGTIVELERESIVPLGDGVIEMQWDSRLDRPTLTIHPPDAYHPVLEGVDDGRYPSKVHLAWGFERIENGETKSYVRRITYELVETSPYPVAYQDRPATMVCLKSDGTWPLDDLGDRTIEDLTPSKAVWAETPDGERIEELELPIDFIPVIHYPNGESSVEHFGESSLASVIQLVEQITQADTDAALASRIAGTPQVAVTGTMVDDDLELKPGGIWDLGQDGRMDTIDQSPALAAIGAYVEDLQQRAEQVVRVPAGIVGRDLKTGAETGISRQIRNYPFTQNVNRLRLSREGKNRLLLKFAQRIALQSETDNKPIAMVDASIVYGSNLPNDLGGTADTVVALLNAKSISKGTAITMLREAGLSITDIGAELQQIRAEDPDGAVKVADATGSEALGAQWLGLESEGVEVDTGLPNTP